MQKIKYIDGLRGWAAICVVIFHLTWELFGGIIPEFRSIYLKFILDGPLAVYIFFIISGVALSNAYIKTGDDFFLTRLILKRYFRLAIPILFSCALVFFLMTFDLIYNYKASVIVNRGDWLGQFLPFHENIINMISYSLYGVFVNHRLENSYNPFLWPMGIELFGSLILFCFLMTYKKLKTPKIIAACCALASAFFGSFYSLFFLGVFFSILMKDGFFDRFHKNKILSLLSFLGILVTILCDTFVIENVSQIKIAIAASLCFFIFANKFMISLFANKFSTYLGKISFPIYIIHFAVIASYSSWLILFFKNELNQSNILFIVLSSFAISLILAEIVSRLEKKFLNFLDVTITRTLMIKS